MNREPYKKGHFILRSRGGGTFAIAPVSGVQVFRGTVKEPHLPLLPHILEENGYASCRRYSALHPLLQVGKLCVNRKMFFYIIACYPR